MSLNLCECGGEVDIRFGGHDANFYAECRECGKTVDLEAVDMPGAVQEWNNRKGKPTKNYIPEIAKMLGVKIGEEFHVILHGSPMMSRYRITKTQAQYQPLKDGEWVQAGRALECFLNGEAEIVKLTGKKWEEK